MDGFKPKDDKEEASELACPLVVTLDGVPCEDQKAALEEFKARCTTHNEKADAIALGLPMENTSSNRRSALQDWVMDLTVMQQSVLMAAVRGPDGIHKNHPVKVLLRWYRRSFLISAFERQPILDPYTPGGGSFTGPLRRPQTIESYINTYLEHVDEIPHHFQLHLMHAAEILGYKHPVMHIRMFWYKFYRKVVNDAHLFPETEEQMDSRLGDNEVQWRAREEVTAK